MTPASRFVPYSFARDNAILLVPKSERDAEVWISDATPLAALPQEKARPSREALEMVMEELR